jgi:putative ABC transport system permease protein
MRFFDMVGLARDNLSRARLRTALTAMGVAIGTAAVVTLVAVGTGAQAIFVQRAATYGQLTSVLVFPTTPRSRQGGGQFHALTPATQATIAHMAHVSRVGVQLSMPALRLSVDGRSRVLDAEGVSPLRGVPPLDTVDLVAGSTAGTVGTASVLVPASTARALGFSPAALVGRPVTFTAGGSVCCTAGTNGSSGPAGATGGSGMVVVGPDLHFAARVAGVYRDKDSAAPLILTTALGATIDGRLRGMSGATYLNRQGYSILVAVADDARQTSALAGKIGALSYHVVDRSDLLSEVHLVFTILTGGLGAIGGIALLVAAIGIANTMIMTILERTREIGIMKALGAEPSMVRRLFLVETALVGLFGGAVGLVLAALASVAGNAIFRIWLKNAGVTEKIGALFSIPLQLVVGALVLAVVVSLLAGAWPSRRAMRLQPLEALRYE